MVADRMRVLVAPHNFELGGSQINALELIEELADDPEFELVVYAPDGQLAERARALDVELHLTRLREHAPSPVRMFEIWRLVGRRKIDLVHTYEWMPTVDAAFAAAWGRGTPLLSTVLSMDYPYFLPRSVPLVLGTRALVSRAASESRDARLLEPPVDTDLFRPDALPADVIDGVRAECGATSEDRLVVVVGRLAQMLKLDGLLSLVAAMGELDPALSARLAIVGDGPERASVEAAANDVNARSGREVVRLLGARVDPLPYYLAADIAVGMGGSALRSMAVGKPLVVQGEQGFWSVADDESLPMFREHGWYGVGSGVDSSSEACARELTRLLTMDDAGRAHLGAMGRRLIVDEYSLRGAAQQLGAMYREVGARVPSWRERLSAPWALGWELSKSAIAVRSPALQDMANRLRGRARASRVHAPEQSTRPAVSVVIPCHNYAAYLDEAVESALRQDGVDVNVTVIDDGSTDGSLAVAQGWAERDARVRVISHAVNRGHIATFNEALDAATAPYVVKLDADDVLTPGSLRRSVDVLEACPNASFVYGGVEHVQGPMPSISDTSDFRWSVTPGRAWIGAVARHRGRNPISQPEIMIRRSALAVAGGHRSEVPGTSDLHLWLRLASVGDVARITGAVQGLYRIHGASMRATIHSGLLLDVQARRDAFALFLAERGDDIDDSARLARSVWRSLAKDAVTNGFLDLEAGRDPEPLMAEALRLDAAISRTAAWRLLVRQQRHDSRSIIARAGRAGRDLSSRWRWHRHRLLGV